MSWIMKPSFCTFVTPSMGRTTLKRTVQSLLDQSDWDWLSIIVFDGKEPIKLSGLNPDINYLDDNHFKVLSCPIQRHAGLVRNFGMKDINTKFLAFVDDDDWLDSDYITSLKKWSTSNPEADLIIFTYRDQTNGNTQPPRGMTNLQFGNVGISFAVKTDFLIKNSIEFRKRDCEDWGFIEECLNKGAKFVMTQEVKYRVGGRGQWQL